MPDITTTEDYSYSPEKQLIRDFNVAFAEADNDKILSLLADDVEWDMVGSQTIHSKQEAGEVLVDMVDTTVTELVINDILGEGDTYAATGSLKFQDGNTVKYGDFYTFVRQENGLRVKKLVSFAVELP